jgi:hypothetical protein
MTPPSPLPSPLRSCSDETRSQLQICEKNCVKLPQTFVFIEIVIFIIIVNIFRFDLDRQGGTVGRAKPSKAHR